MSVNPPDEAVACLQASDVGRVARRGATWAGAAVVAQQVIALGVSVALARLLTPTAYGINGMAMTITTFLTFVSDGGLSVITLQRRELSKQQVDNLFWINVAVGVLMWVTCIVTAPMAAAFYKRPELLRVMPVFGFTFVAGGVTVQPLALMRRNIQQREIAIQMAISSLAFAAIGIGMAYLKYSYWALVFQTVGYTCVRAVAAFVQSGYRPGRWRSHVGTRSLLKFGGAMCLSAVLVYLTRNLDNIVIGRHWGADALGYYSRAYLLMMAPAYLIAATLNDVMIPSLSALLDDRERMGAAYRRSTRLVAFLACPVGLWMALAAPEVIRLVYGPKWMPVAPMLVWLSLAGVLQPLGSTASWLFLVMGDLRRLLLWNAFSVVVLAATFIGTVRFGPVALAQAYAYVMTLVLTAPGLILAHGSAKLPLRKTIESVAPIMLGAIVAALAALVVSRLVAAHGVHWLALLAVKTLVGLVVYGAWSLWRLRPLPLERLESLACAWLPSKGTT